MAKNPVSRANHVAYPTLDLKSQLDSSSFPSTPPKSSQHSTHAEPHSPPHSLAHDAHSCAENPRLSQLVSDRPASLSNSSMASAPFPKVTQARAFHPSQPALPAAAFILSSNTQPASMSDSEPFTWQEHSGWAQKKHNMTLGALAIEPASQRPRTHVSVSATDYDDDEDDDVAHSSDHENAFYILVRC
ncbi:hypothetical protein LOZ66_004403 [Ophidiomyces ophidiicola]|nr:hypothetical protein LOZ66_004403 [Ophidiomyces ophidiicola]